MKVTWSRTWASDPLAILGAFLPGLVLAALALTMGLRFPMYHDEHLYLPVAVDFSRGVDLGRIATYNGIRVIAGPAIFAVYGAWLRLVGGSLVSARVLSITLAAAVGIISAAIGRRSGVERPILFAVGLVSLPLYLVTGITFLSEPLAISATLLGVWLWLRGVDRSEWSWAWWSSIPLAVAVNVRLPLLSVPLALCASGAFIVRRKSAACGPLLAIVAQAPFWIAWRGVVPPAHDVDTVPGVVPRAGLHVDTFVHMVTILGFLFWPALRRPRLAVAIAWSLVGLVLYRACGPDLSVRFAGPLRAMALRSRWGWLLGIAFLAGWNLLAKAALGALDTFRPVPLRTLDLLGLAGVGIYAASPLAFDRYSLTFSPIWLLALSPVLEAGRRRWVWAGWLASLLIMTGVSCAIIYDVIPSPALKVRMSSQVGGLGSQCGAPHGKARPSWSSCDRRASGLTVRQHRSQLRVSMDYSKCNLHLLQKRRNGSLAWA